MQLLSLVYFLKIVMNKELPAAIKAINANVAMPTVMPLLHHNLQSK